MRRVLTMGLAVTVAAGSLRLYAQTQAPLSHIRDLYASAAYEDVLSAVATDTTASPQIGQYKVFSLLALGRLTDAAEAAEAVLAAHLGFHPDADASPRLIELFTQVRRRIAPDQLTSMYLNARRLLDSKERERAIQAFADIAAVASDPDLKDDKTVSELGLLANGFLELSRALPTAAPPAAPAGAPATKAELPARTGSPAPDSGASRSARPVVSPAKPIREDLPRWTPPASLARAEYKGRISVRVGVDGRVESAKILDSIHPLYDGLLLNASKNWLYTPALNDGSPMPSEHIVEVALKPRLEPRP